MWRVGRRKRTAAPAAPCSGALMAIRTVMSHMFPRWQWLAAMIHASAADHCQVSPVAVVGWHIQHISSCPGFLWHRLARLGRFAGTQAGRPDGSPFRNRARRVNALNDE
jgi:hypothetical protein